VQSHSSPYAVVVAAVVAVLDIDAVVVDAVAADAVVEADTHLHYRTG